MKKKSLKITLVLFSVSQTILDFSYPALCFFESNTQSLSLSLLKEMYLVLQKRHLFRVNLFHQAFQRGHPAGRQVAVLEEDPFAALHG